MEPALIALQQRLQHQFANPALLQRAVTHRSFSADNNERLEFLGDSVLSLAISSLLYARLASMPEGDLSRVRANLVREETLHKIALRLQLPDLLRLGEGESKSGGKQRPSILADAVEALIGAVYLDAGFSAGEKVVHHLFDGVDINPQMRAAEKDPKTALQELLQGKRMKLPHYEVLDISGVAHKQIFTVGCTVTEWNISAQGTGSSRRAGEQAAAAAVLEQLKVKKS
ncbi:MAG: ribonuclease III [Comamonas sp.]|uniref:ribonuclease III n=1 Tax=Comamonas TaxID=283 RepID=UPI000EB44F79|nr:ribonuclease III [Comamonas sp. lk]